MGGREVLFITFTSFIILFVSLVSNAPTEILQSGYNPIGIETPEEFEAYKILMTDILSLEQSLIWQQRIEYKFEDTVQLDRFFVNWGYPLGINNFITVNRGHYYWTSGYFIERMNPDTIDKALLLASWDSEENFSFVRAYDNKGSIECYFEDQNITRTDIELAYDARELNCTIVYSRGDETRQKLGARDIVMSLLAFRLPSIFPSLNPSLGIVLSIVFYIPLAFMTFFIITTLLHGD